MRFLNRRLAKMYHKSRSNKALIYPLVLALGFVWSCTRNDKPMLRVLAFRDRHSAALRALLPEFEKTSGIKVKFDEIPAESVATKMMTDLAGGGTYDVYVMDEPFLPQFSSYLLPVSQWSQSALGEKEGGGAKSEQDISSASHLKRGNHHSEHGSNSKMAVKIGSKLPSASDSFELKALEASHSAGELMGLPVNGNVYQYIYRRDLFESPDEKSKFMSQFGRPLHPARSFEEVLELAEFYYRPPALYGFAPFTKMSEGTTVELLWLLAGFGITPANDDPQLTKIEKALSFYLKLLSFSPKAAKSWHHTERMSAYAKGKIAQMMTWNSFFQDLEDDNKSLVVSKTGFALSPTGFAAESDSPEPSRDDTRIGQKTIFQDHDGMSGFAGSKTQIAKLVTENETALARPKSPVDAEDSGQREMPTSLAGTWIAGVRKDSQQTKAAAEFIRWWTSRSINERLIAKGLSTARQDLLTDPELGVTYPWFATTHFNFERAFLRPRHRDYKLVSHKLSKAFTRLIASQTDLKTAALEIREAMVDMNKLASAKNSLGEVR